MKEAFPIVTAATRLQDFKNCYLSLLDAATMSILYIKLDNLPADAAEADIRTLFEDL